MSTRRRAVIAILLLASLGAAVIVAPVTCVRRPAAPQAVVITFDVPANLNESESPGRSFPYDAFRPNRLTLYQVEHAIRVAATDDQVRGLVLHIDGLNWGWAQIAEVREALRAFRHRGKPVYAALAGGGEREYLLATAAGKVCAPPTATLALDGLAV